MHFNKKASLEMSIQAIVIVVLAMTLLGLGLGFIKGMFRNITSTTEDVSEQVRQKVLDDLVQGDKKISFPKTEVTIDKGGSSVLTVGIKNKLNTPLYYRLQFTTIDVPQKPTATPTPANEASQIANKKTDFDGYFQYDKNKRYTLSAAEADVRNIRLNVPVIDSGSYLLKFSVYPALVDNSGNALTGYSTEPYATKEFFVIVRG